MTAFLTKLLHLKENRQASAARALQRKRVELQQAEQTLTKAENALQAAVSGYERQVDTLYEPLIGQAIDMRRIEDVESKIADLDRHRQELSDAVDDSADHVADVKEAEQGLLKIYAEKSRAFERLDALVDELKFAARTEAERHAELELEEGVHNRKGFAR